jgi:hypothetical protein
LLHFPISLIPVPFLPAFIAKLELTPILGADLTEERIIRPAKNVHGSLRLPGDKSISHQFSVDRLSIPEEPDAQLQ